MKKEQLAINSVSLRFTDLQECLAACHEAGFGQIELPLAQVKAHLQQGASAADLRRLLDQHQLRCIGGFEIAVACFAPPPQRRQNRDQLLANARLLAELGAETMVVGTDGPADGKAVDDPTGEIAAHLAELADLISQTGITICLEFNWSPLVKSLWAAADIVRLTARDNVGVLFDTAHYHCTPTKLEHLTAENVATIKAVHLNDMRAKPPELCNCNADRVLPGDGCLDLPAILQRLEDGGYRGAYSIEMFSDQLWSLPAHEAARQMYQSLLPYCR